MKKLFLISFLLFASVAEAGWMDKKMMEMSQREFDKQSMICLAKNIYFEARDQSTKGQIGVALVTINRVKSKHFPNTMCEVVHQGQKKNGKMLLHKCHFSWYCDGKSDTPRDRMSWAISKLIARAMLLKPGVHIKHFGEKWEIEDFLHGATHYHRVDIEPPYWTAKMLKYSTIDDHIFYIDPYRR